MIDFNQPLLYLNGTVLAERWQHSQATNCTLGQENTDQVSALAPAPGIFLDISSSAECDGQVISWSLCYYRTSVFNEQYQVEFQVWRRTSNNRYSMIGAAMQTVTAAYFQDTAFNCRNFPLSESNYISIESGDLLGAHIVENTHTTTNTLLRVLGFTTTTGDDQDMLFYTDQVSSSTLQANELTRVDGAKLHISASILGKECTGV